MPTHESMTLVTGATGNIGGALAGRLAEAGAGFKVMCRRAEQVEDFTARGIDAVRGDLSDPESLRAAMAGCGQLFLLPPVTPTAHELDRNAIDAARDAGVQHVVKVSTADANPQSSVPWAAAHALSDAYLRESGLRWTLLTATCFMENLESTAAAIKRGVLPGTSGRGATTWVATTDIAAAAARVLRDPATQGDAHAGGRSHLLTGTGPLSYPQVADILSDQLDRRVRYLHLAGPVMYAGLRVSGCSRWLARGLVHQFGDVVRHGLDGVHEHSEDLAELLGRPPTDLPAFVRDRSSRFT